jgi:hypothetical protein
LPSLFDAAFPLANSSEHEESVALEGTAGFAGSCQPLVGGLAGSGEITDGHIGRSQVPICQREVRSIAQSFENLDRAEMGVGGFLASTQIDVSHPHVAESGRLEAAVFHVASDFGDALEFFQGLASLGLMQEDTGSCVLDIGYAAAIAGRTEDFLGLLQFDEGAASVAAGFVGLLVVSIGIYQRSSAATVVRHEIVTETAEEISPRPSLFDCGRAPARVSLDGGVTNCHIA